MDDPAYIFPSPVLSWQEAVWLILTAFMFLSWWNYFARCKSKEFNIPERILSTFVATVAQIIITILLTGILHIIGWWQLFIPNLIISLGILVVTVRIKTGRLIHEEIRHAGTELWTLIKSSGVLLIFLIIALITSAWWIYLGQLAPPMGSDAYLYHFVWPALVHQEGHLGPFDLNQRWINFYPKNMEIIYLWFIEGCGYDRWANVAQAPFAAAAILGCYQLARRVNSSRIESAFCSILLISFPTLVHQMWRGYVDLAAFGLSVISLAFISREKLTFSSVLMAGISVGILVGIKGSAIITFFVLLLFLIYRLLPFGYQGFKFEKEKRVKSTASVLILFCGIAFIFGSYFYIKNMAATGNPTGDYTVEILGMKLYEGETDVAREHFNVRQLGSTLFNALKERSEWSIVFDGFYDPQPVFVQDNRIGGWGAVWPIFLLPAIPAAFIFAFLKRKWNLIAILLGCLLPFFLFKYNHTWTRYHMLIFAAGTTSFAYLLSLETFNRLKNGLIAGALTFSVMTILIINPQPINGIQPADITGYRQSPYSENDRYKSFLYWGNKPFCDALNDVLDAGTTLALADAFPRHRNLAAWNSRFTNRVVAVEWDGSPISFVDALESKNVDVIYIGPANDALMYVAEQPELFVPIVFSEDIGGLYYFINE